MGEGDGRQGLLDPAQSWPHIGRQMEQEIEKGASSERTEDGKGHGRLCFNSEWQDEKEDGGDVGKDH